MNNEFLILQISFFISFVSRLKPAPAGVLSSKSRQSHVVCGLFDFGSGGFFSLGFGDFDFKDV